MRMADGSYFGGIELGGTKIVLAAGLGDGEIVARSTLPTPTPELVMPEICAFFRDCGLELDGLGVGAFGPINIDPTAQGYGRLLETNKPGWSGFDLAGALTAELGLPISLVTDVGAAAIGEARLGALRSAALGVYLTVGTGIGGAILANGTLLPAMLHPEIGHITVLRLADDHALSTCLFHPNCAEGLAAGPAIIQRFGYPLNQYPEGGAEHLLVAHYLGHLCASLVLTLSPHRIVIGGGVGQTPGLIPEILRAMLARLGGYAVPGLDDADFLCPPALGQDAGIIGALHCAADLAATRRLPHSTNGLQSLG